MKRLNGFVSVVVMMLAVFVLLAGCSSSGGGDDATPTPTPTPTPSASMSLSGTAAVGAPIASATITLKDSAGAVKSVVTGTDGKYTIDTTGMTAPFLLKVPSGTSSLYSVATATATGVANVHPFTDLIIRNWYKVQGSDVDTVFGGTGALAAAPTATEINTIEAVIRQVLTQLLQSADIDPAQFNLLTTSFNANNTGFDNVLERTQVTIAAGGQVTVTMIDPNTGTVGGTIIAMPINTTITTATNPIDVAKTAINAGLSNFKDTLNAKQCSFAVGDIQPFLVPGYLNGGYDAVALAAAFKGSLGCPNPSAVTDLSITKITTYDDTTKTATGTLNFRMANGNGNSGDNMMFRNVNGVWLMDGDQEIAEIFVNSKVENHIRTTQNSPSGYVNSLEMRIYDYMDQQIVSVAVSGPGVNSTNSTYWDICTTPTSSPPACDNNSYKTFRQDIDITPTVGSVYTITLTKADSSTVSYKRTLIATPGLSGAATDFPNISFSGTSTHSLSAVIGQTITEQIYLPSWITEISTPGLKLWNGNTYLGSVPATWTGTPALGQNNGFTVAVPSTFNTQAVTMAVISKDTGAWGIKGWGQTAVWWYFE